MNDHYVAKNEKHSLQATKCSNYSSVAEKPVRGGKFWKKIGAKPIEAKQAFIYFSHTLQFHGRGRLLNVSSFVESDLQADFGKISASYFCRHL